MVAVLRLLLMSCLCLGLAACGERERDVDAAVEKGVLLLGNGIEPRTLDPQLNTGAPDGEIIATLSETLVLQDIDDPNGVVPGVAERWEHDASFTEWTFHLRKDAKWSDGTPLTASDFLYSYRRILTPALGAELAELFYSIAGAEAFNKGESDDFARVGIRAPDAHTLRLTLVEPNPYLLNILSTYTFSPVQQAALERHGAMTDRDNTWFEVGKFVGNGPFVLSEWKTNQYVEVRKNPHYWDAANVHLNAIRFFAIENQKSELNAWISGQIHATQGLPVDRIASLRKEFPEALNTSRQHASNY